MLLLIETNCSTCGSIFVGHYLSILFSPRTSIFLGSSFLILLGFYNIYKTLNISPTNFDIDYSNYIDKKEAVLLGLMLSIDSICVGIGCGVIGFNDLLLPILVSIFQLFFINCGNTISNKIVNRIKISDIGLSLFSSIILILVEILRIIF